MPAVAEARPHAPRRGRRRSNPRAGPSLPRRTTANRRSPTAHRWTRNPHPAPAPARTGGQAPGSVSYRNCTAVRQAGAAPIRRGRPGLRFAPRP
ncbi:excalibur calcium-binding domain-containing protein [Streptomyces sp. NPDC054865]